MADHVEAREFLLRFELRCAFPEGYDGDADGYEWMREFPAIAQELVTACARIVAAHPGWSVRGGNRGRSSNDEVTLVAQRAC